MNEWPDELTTRLPTTGVCAMLSARMHSSVIPPKGTRVRLDYLVDPADEEPPRVTWWDVDPAGAWVINAIYLDAADLDTVAVMFVSLAAWREALLH